MTLLRREIFAGRGIGQKRVKRASFRLRRLSGGKIYQNADSFRYLRLREAEGCCLAEDIVFLRKSASLSTLMEELIHSLQFKLKIYDSFSTLYGNAAAVCLMEYQASCILVEHESLWKVPRPEREKNRKRRSGLKRIVKVALGSSPCHSNLKLHKSKKCLAPKLAFLMGN